MAKFEVDATTRNAVFIQRLAKGEFNKHNRFFTEWQRSVNGFIGMSDFTPANQRALTIEIARINKEFLDEFGKATMATGVSTGEYSAGFTQRLMNKVSKTPFALPDSNVIEAKVLQAVMEMSSGVTPLTVQEAIFQFGEKKALGVNQALSDGFLTGATNDEILASVNTQINIARRQGEALVRTVVNSAANVGRVATMIENKDLLKGYEWVAKLDDRTTDICNDRDGNIYEFKAGSPLPPAHWNCRSQITPVMIDGERKTR